MMHGWGGGIWMASGCWSSGRHHPPDRLRDPGRVERPDARELLEERFARGEISEEQFLGRKQVLARQRRQDEPREPRRPPGPTGSGGPLLVYFREDRPGSCPLRFGGGWVPTPSRLQGDRRPFSSPSGCASH